MTCRFLENLTLASLIAPVGEEEFRATYWEKAPLIIHRQDPGYYGDLFTLQDFADAIALDLPYVKFANAATKKSGKQEGATAGAMEAVLAEMRDGTTLVLDAMQLREQKLALLCRILAQELSHNFATNIYLTPPNGKGFSPHWDNHDVFIIQVMGSKHWKIEKQRRAVPRRMEKIEPDERDLRGELYSFTLNQGDVIYIPRGFVHAAECGAEASLHITLGFVVVTLDDVLHAAIEGAVKRNERLRAALPLGFMHHDRHHLVASLMAGLREASDEKFLNFVVDQYKDELVSRFPLDISNQVLNFFQPASLTVGDVVGPNRGIVYQIHDGNESVRLYFGGRTFDFPVFFRDALHFALRTPSFAIGQLPGELEDEERLVFVERLMQEGLVVRT